MSDALKQTRQFDVLKVSSSRNRNVPRFGTEVKSLVEPDDTCVMPDQTETNKISNFFETKGVTSKTTII